jgi:hypothetical protein
VSAQEPGNQPEDRGLVTRVGPLEIDWPKSLGYYGGIGLAVAFEVIEPPLAIFIAAIPVLKLLKHPREPWPFRVVADVLEGAAKPVGGDTESVVRVADATQRAVSSGRPPRSTPGQRSRAPRRQPSSERGRAQPVGATRQQ